MSTIDIVVDVRSRACGLAPYEISTSEYMVIQGLAQGKTNKAVAAGIGLSPLTIKSHIARITTRLNLQGREQLVALAVLQGWVERKELPQGLISEREFQVLRIVAEGWSNKQTAFILDISEHTVKTHLARIMKKLEVGSRAELALFVEQPLVTK